ncbi:MAG: hypothetical protein VCE43_16260 [Myxococcota bacterium]
MGNPIYSSRAEDPDLIVSIEDFVIGLAERIDELQDAEFKGDSEQLQSFAISLAQEADALGFDLLAASAHAVEGCSGAFDGDEVREVLLDLTEIAKRIRRGHRGAV